MEIKDLKVGDIILMVKDYMNYEVNNALFVIKDVKDVENIKASHTTNPNYVDYWISKDDNFILAPPAIQILYGV